MEGEASVEFSIDSASGSTDLSGGGSYSLVVKTPKGDSSASIEGKLSSALEMEATPGGYYSLVLNSLTISVHASISLPIPQLCWRVCTSSFVCICVYVWCVRRVCTCCPVVDLHHWSTTDALIVRILAHRRDFRRCERSHVTRLRG